MAKFFDLDAEGFERMSRNLDPKNRAKVLREAMYRGGSFVRKTVRTVYKESKPQSTLGNAIMLHIFPSGEGAVVRRFYVKGGQGHKFSKKSDFYRAYILNILEKGGKDRKTRRGYNRGTAPALRFFSRGTRRAKKNAMNIIRQYLENELIKQANK